MFKIAGMLFILAGCMGLGYWKSRQLSKRLSALDELIKLIILIEEAVNYENYCLPDVFKRIAGKMSDKFCVFLKNLADEMMLCNNKSLELLFRDQIKKNLSELPFSKEEKQYLYSLGASLGYLNKTLQFKQLELCKKEIEFHKEKVQEEAPGKKKVYESLGVLGGLLLVILLW